MATCNLCLIQATILLAILSLTQIALAADKTSRVKIKKGDTTAEVKGTIVGYDVHNYVLNAKAGQTIQVKVEQLKGNGIQYRVFLKDNDSVTVGGILQEPGMETSGQLPESGDYVLAIGVNRNQARQKQVNRYSANITVHD